MTTNEPADTEQPWGAQPPAPPAQQRPRWSGRKTGAAVAIAVAIAAGGGAAIYAATANDSATQQTGPGFGPGGGMGRPGGGLADALHGEFVVANGSTELLQNGAVTSITDTSVAVRSSDGYAKTYTIDSSTVKAATIQTGTQVTVIATESGTAISISEPGAMRPGDGRPGPQTP